MKLTTPKTTEKTTKKLKFNVFNIKSLLVFNRKKLDKVKKEKQRFSLFQKKKEKVKQKEEKIESPRTMGSTLKNIAGALLAKPKSIIDKLKEFFGIILLGILVNNLPRIVKELQKVLGEIKKFFDDNPWIGKTIKFAFDIIAKGMMGILDLTKTLMPVIGGSFKFALDTIKTTKNEIGKLIKFFDDLGGGIGALMTSFGYKPPAKAAQAYARSKGKYYSSTTGKTYGSYSQALKNPQVKKGAQQYANQRVQKALAAPSRGYTANKGTTSVKTEDNQVKQVVVAPLTTGYGANRKTEYVFKDPNNLNAEPIRLKANDPALKPSIQRYQAVNQANKVQKLSIGGTIRNFFSGMFGGSRRGLGNIPPQEGTGRGSPSDIRLTTKDDGKSYAGPYASPAGTAKGRKARETVNYFKIFENNIDLQTRRLGKEEKNLDIFSEFMKSYENLSELRKKYGDLGLTPRTPPGGSPTPSDEAISVDPDEVIGKVGDTGRSYGAHIHIEDYSTPGASIPTSVKSNILVAGKPMTSGTMTSGIGMRWGRPHNGEDWDQNWENKNISLTGGLKFVKYIPMGSDSRFDGYGNVVIIQAPDNKKYFLGHLNAGPPNLKELLRRQRQQLSQRTPGGSNEEKIWNYFRSKGLSEVAVSGILGNASIESTFRPSALSPDGRFKGIFQWGTKNESGNRWGSLVKWAKSKDLDPENIETQLKFSWVEMTETGTPYYDSKSGEGLNKLRNAKTPEEAAKIWHGYYERASAPSPIREKEAAKLYKKWKGKAPQKAQPVLSPTQKLEKNIVTTMINDLGTRSITVGDKNISIEKKDGKDVIKVTTGGVFGIGAKQLQLDENLLNNLLYEIKNKGTKVDPVQPVRRQGGPDGSSGVLNNASTNTVLLNQTIAYLLPGPSQAVPVPGETKLVLVGTSQRPSNSIILRQIRQDTLA